MTATLDALDALNESIKMDQAAAAEAPTAAPTPETDPEEVAAATVPVTAEQVIRVVAEAAPAASKKRASAPRKPVAPKAPTASAQAKKLLGAGDRYAVHKIVLGKSAKYVGQYSHQDVARQGSVEAFLQTHIVPVEGPGTFELSALDASGKVLLTREYNVGALPGVGPNPAAHVQAPPKTLADKAAEFKALKDVFGGGVDPMMMHLLMRETTPAPMPMPALPPMPPPPKDNTMESVAALIAATKGPSVIELMTAFAPILAPLIAKVMEPKEDSFEKALKLMSLIDKRTPDAGLDLNYYAHMKGRLKEIGMSDQGSVFKELAQVVGAVMQGKNVAPLTPGAAAGATHTPEPAADTEPEQDETAEDDAGAAWPDGCVEHFAALDNVGTDAERIDHVLRGIGALGDDDTYRVGVRGIFMSALLGDADSVLASLGRVLEEARGDGILTADAVTATLDAVRNNFAHAVEHAKALLAKTQAAGTAPTSAGANDVEHAQEGPPVPTQTASDANAETAPAGSHRRLRELINEAGAVDENDPKHADGAAHGETGPVTGDEPTQGAERELAPA